MFFLLSAILVPMLVGVALLSASPTHPLAERLQLSALVGLITGLVLYALFDSSLAGAYNFELKLPRMGIGIYLHLGLNGLSMPLFLLARIVRLYGLYSWARRRSNRILAATLRTERADRDLRFVDVFFSISYEFALVDLYRGRHLGWITPWCSDQGDLPDAWGTAFSLRFDSSMPKIRLIRSHFLSL